MYNFVSIDGYYKLTSNRTVMTRQIRVSVSVPTIMQSISGRPAVRDCSSVTSETITDHECESLCVFGCL